MAIEINEFRPWFSVTFRIRKNVYQTDPTNNAVYNRLRTQQLGYLSSMFSDGTSVSPYRQDFVLIQEFLSDYFVDKDTSSFLPVGFSGFNGGVPNVNLSSYCVLSVYQRLLADPSGSTARFPASRSAQNAGMSIRYIIEKFASGTALPVQTRNMMSDSARGLSVDEMKNVRTIENEMDATSYIRDVEARKAADDAAKASEAAVAADNPPNSDN